MWSVATEAQACSNQPFNLKY